MNKRQRTTPDQWSYVSKAWNASTLAEQVTKLTGENEELTDTLNTCSNHLEQYKILYEQAQENYEKYKAGYQQKHIRAEELTAELNEAVKAEAVAAKAHADDVAHKKQMAANTVAKKQSEIDSLTSEVTELKRDLANTVAKKQSEIDSLTSVVAELKRDLAEQRGRTKTWRVRYEKLVSDGTKALANKTVSEYGVTPDEVALYKNFAQKQAAAEKAAKLAREAALEATTVGLKSLTNA